MTTALEAWRKNVKADGYTVVPAVFTPVEVEAMLAILEETFQLAPKDGAIRSDSGSIYAARNVLTL